MFPKSEKNVDPTTQVKVLKQLNKSFGYRTILLHFGTFESMGMPLAYRSEHWASMPIAISERLAPDEAL
jgi:hypothetical protein